MNQMKPEQQRIKIAESCGWKWRFAGKIWPHMELVTPEKAKPLQRGFGPKEPSLRTVKKELKNWPVYCLPDYINDLNAMAMAEATLKSSLLQWGLYCNTLGLICGGAHEDDGGVFVSHKEAIDATAAQRAEAFLKTLGLWEDSK
jgi:hypothetical protein